MSASRPAVVEPPQAGPQLTCPFPNCDAEVAVDPGSELLWLGAGLEAMAVHLDVRHGVVGLAALEALAHVGVVR